MKSYMLDFAKRILTTIQKADFADALIVDKEGEPQQIINNPLSKTSHKPHKAIGGGMIAALMAIPALALAGNELISSSNEDKDTDEEPSTLFDKLKKFFGGEEKPTLDEPGIEPEKRTLLERAKEFIRGKEEVTLPKEGSSTPIKLSGRGLATLKEFEAFSPIPYDDFRGKSIGYGHLIQSDEAHLLTTKISKQEATLMLAADVEKAEKVVKNNITVPLRQSQFDALVMFAYNVGSGAFAKSTLVKKLNAKDYSGAATEFKRWIRAGGKENRGLKKRRQKELEIFARGYEEEQFAAQQTSAVSITAPSAGNTIALEEEFKPEPKTETVRTDSEDSNKPPAKVLQIFNDAMNDQEYNFMLDKRKRLINVAG